MSGWGDGDWASPSFVQNTVLPLNECRELVEVPGGAEWKIRKLQDSDPEYCWKYSGTTTIVQYHFDNAIKQEDERVLRPSNESIGDSPRLPVFYATLPHFVSPFEISLQPKYLDRVRKNITSQMNQVYKSCDFSFTEDQLFVPVACACQVGNEWFRARISRISGHAHATVEMIDFGTEKMVPLASLRPLVARFGRVPPMALRCRVKDVYVNDLDTAKVEHFKQLIHGTGNLVRVELCSTVEPYFVNLFHPTVNGLNLGKVFYRPADDIQREQAKCRRWQEHLDRENCDNAQDFDSDDEDEDFYDEDEEEEYVEPPRQFIQSFDRSAKGTRAGGDCLAVCHVENNRLIYLQSQWMIEDRKEAERELETQWNSLPPLPPSWLKEGTACAVRTKEGRFHRASIESIRNGATDVDIVLIDHGLHLLVGKDCLRAIPEHDLLVAPPLLYVLGLNGCSDTFPHPSETNILREILPMGTVVRFAPDKKHKRVPMRGSLIIDQSSVNVELELSNRLLLNHVDTTCRALVVWHPLVSPLSRVPDRRFNHRTHCPNVFVKGNLIISPIPQE